MNPILCGSFLEYKELLQRMSIPLAVGRKMYPYISDSHQLMAMLRHTTVFRYGSWRDRIHVDRVITQCKMRAFNFIDLGE